MRKCCIFSLIVVKNRSIDLLFFILFEFPNGTIQFLFPNVKTLRPGIFGFCLSNLSISETNTGKIIFLNLI